MHIGCGTGRGCRRGRVPLCRPRCKRASRPESHPRGWRVAEHDIPASWSSLWYWLHLLKQETHPGKVRAALCASAVYSPLPIAIGCCTRYLKPFATIDHQIACEAAKGYGTEEVKKTQRGEGPAKKRRRSQQSGKKLRKGEGERICQEKLEEENGKERGSVFWRRLRKRPGTMKSWRRNGQRKSSFWRCEVRKNVQGKGGPQKGGERRRKDGWSRKQGHLRVNEIFIAPKKSLKTEMRDFSGESYFHDMPGRALNFRDKACTTASN